MTRSIRIWMPALLILLVAAGAVMYTPHLAGRFAYAMESGKNAANRSELVEMSKQDRLSPLFRLVSKTIKPAVVEVRVVERVKMRMQLPGMNEHFRRFFGDDMPGGLLPSRPMRPREYIRRGLGSGVIVDAENGYVLTNHHVVAGADKVQVVLADNRKFDARWVRSDWKSDLAIVKIEADGLISAPLGDSDAVEVGDWVLAIGSPERLPQTVTAGIISAKGRTTRRSGLYQDFLQTDAAINHGNSGGPLVNMRGEVIGINAAIVSRTGVNEGIGLAIPSNLVRNVMMQLIDGGKVIRGYLGVGIQELTHELAESFGLPDTDGVLVGEVFEETPASRAGFREGDVIVAVNGRNVRNVNELRHAVAALKPGATVPVEVYREGGKKTLKVKIATQPVKMAALPGAKSPSDKIGKFGIKVATLNEETARRYGYHESKKGVVIAEVAKGSDAAEKGLREGMIILRIQGRKVATGKDVERILSTRKSASGVRIMFADRKGHRRYVFITPEK